MEDYLVKGRGDGELIVRSIRYAIKRKKAEEKLAYLAQDDPLTGFANRALFQDRLEQALARAGRNGDMGALMFLDRDRFKALNDTLGHAGGDALLEEVARRVEGRVRDSDTVARLGGDEFVIILEDLSDAQDAAVVARDVLDREEFLLHYQPQVDLRTGRIAGAEAPLRWQHPDRGLVSPAEFIPVLEDTGDIGKVGEWVLRTACRQGKVWQDSGLASLRMAVNLSAR